MHIVEVIQSYRHGIEKTLDNICKEKLRFIESQEHAREWDYINGVVNHLWLKRRANSPAAANVPPQTRYHLQTLNMFLCVFVLQEAR